MMQVLRLLLSWLFLFQMFEAQRGLDDTAFVLLISHSREFSPQGLRFHTQHTSIHTVLNVMLRGLNAQKY